MIRHGSADDIPKLKRLWKDAFGDEDSYINAFFDALFAEENVLLAEENGMLSGASFFLPARLWADGTSRKLRYVYALATDARCRGRGIARELLRQAGQLYQAPLVAEPADGALAEGFYAPLGYQACFYLTCRCVNIGAVCQNQDARSVCQKQDVVTVCQNQDASSVCQNQDIVTACQNQDASSVCQNQEMSAACHSRDTGVVCDSRGISPICQIQEADAASYMRIRDKYFIERFAARGYVAWPLEHIAFAIAQHRESGGGALRVTGLSGLASGEHVLLYYCEHSFVIVTETTLPAGLVLPVLCQWLGRRPKQLKVWQPAKQPGPGEYKLSGMSDRLRTAGGYLNLTLD